MTRLLLISVATAALALPSLANAQGKQDKQDHAAPAGATQHEMAPPGKMGSTPHQSSAPKMNSAGHKAKSETTGQAQREDIKNAKPAAKSAAEEHQPKSETTGQSSESKSGQSNESSKSENKANTLKHDNSAAQKNGSNAAASSTGEKSSASGQGAAGTRSGAALSTEQRTKIRTVFKEKVHVKPVTNVNFSITIGAKVPRTVHFHPVPVDIVEIYPAWHGYEFILVGSQLIIVDPADYEIVAILEV
jgi:hypothetical protein